MFWHIICHLGTHMDDKMFRFQILLTGLFMIIFSHSAVMSQNIFRLQDNIVRMERDIERAQELVTSFNSRKADKKLKQARTEIEQARIEVSKNKSADGEQAQYHLLKAKELTDQAVEIIMNKPVRNLKDRLEAAGEGESRKFCGTQQETG